jgi:hypothetical protein
MNMQTGWQRLVEEKGQGHFHVPELSQKKNKGGHSSKMETRMEGYSTSRERQSLYYFNKGQVSHLLTDAKTYWTKACASCLLPAQAGKRLL